MSSLATHAAGWLRMNQLDPQPQPADVNAGVLGLLLFLGLIASLVLLVVLMNRQLKRVNRNAAEGRYDDLPTRRDDGPGPER